MAELLLCHLNICEFFGIGLSLWDNGVYHPDPKPWKFGFHHDILVRVLV